MIIIDIIKRIHHKTKRKCRRYHEIIMNDDQKKEVIRITDVVGKQYNVGYFLELIFSSNTASIIVLVAQL